MKKKILLGLFIISLLFVTSACGANKNNNNSNDGKTYKVNGVSIKLDKDDDRDDIKYKTSSSFTRNYKTTMSTYTIYKDNSKSKYDLSNIILRVDVNVDIMNTDSQLEKEIKVLNRSESFKNVVQNQKNINGTTWEYFTFENNNDSSNPFKEHLYITEKKKDKYYTVYKVYFSFADDIEEFEQAFMNSIVFD